MEMDYLKYGVPILLLLLQCTICYTRYGCHFDFSNTYTPHLNCTANLYCTACIDFTPDVFSRALDRDIIDRMNCFDFDRYYFKLRLKYTDDGSSEVIPKMGHEYEIYKYNKSITSRLIIELDISGNDYNEAPKLRSMVNLEVLKLSQNFLHVAEIENQGPLPKLKDIDFSFNEIRSINFKQNDVYSSVEKIDLSYNHLEKLTDPHFQLCPLLKTLDLSYNKIHYISKIAFDGIGNLTDLFLSHNKINNLDSFQFRWTYLTNLDLSYNEIEIIKQKHFEEFVNLKTIDLKENKIRNIEPCSFCNMLFLSSIDLRYNKLRKIHKNTFLNKNKLGMTNSNNSLKTILLSDNHIYNISTDTFRKLNNLETLDLSNNNITDFNIYVEDLTSLDTLILRNNFLTRIGKDSFYGLNSLCVLDLTNNKIFNIDSNSFPSMPNLTNLELFNNPLNGTLAEKAFEDLISLPELVISFTRLTTISNSSFFNLPNLRILNLSHNNISDLQYNAFIKIVSIEIIDLSYNRIDTLSLNASELINLKVLLLRNNILKSITESTFFGLVSLKNISLAYNNIKSINNVAFNSQKDLTYLDLSYNSELNFSVNSIVNNTQLKYLYTRGIRKKFSFLRVNWAHMIYLDISNSSIVNVTRLDLKELTQCRNLVLSYNDINKLEVGDFKDLTGLQRLDISSNKISYIQPGVFKDTRLLDFLNISHNLLTVIPYGLFKGLYNLDTLDMSYNSITSLEGHKFYDTKNLKTLIVDKNKIGSINAEEFYGTLLYKLSIGDNLLTCESIVKLRKTLHITALNLNEHQENIDGVTCNMNGYDYKHKTSNGSSVETDRLLGDIKEILLKLVNNKVNSEQSPAQSVNITQFKNITAHDSNIMNKFDINGFILSNVTSVLTEQSDSTNLLLSKILNVLSRPVADTTPFPISINNSEANISSTKSSEALHDNNIKTKEIIVINRSYVFLETCVALILVILVCFSLYKFYISGVYVRARRSQSTTELSRAFESPDL